MDFIVINPFNDFEPKYIIPLIFLLLGDNIFFERFPNYFIAFRVLFYKSRNSNDS
ncbi:hypothetical protein [Rickettsia prowazekii]|uniref:hypothetical protein n=1 Tax=Rickettsia prowazekii TaxID=782 RepID=UPI0002FFD966|nr:hypothetical protein [Rickettsia prowazekii]EOB09753.1 Multidrug resistance protein [Rickettsia prowazekii str. GvF12]